MTSATSTEDITTMMVTAMEREKLKPLLLLELMLSLAIITMAVDTV